ncbi:MAG: hypothetical protein ABSE49_03500 [Polyangiaceae bacterium]
MSTGPATGGVAGPLAAAALALTACNQVFTPVPPPSAWEAGTGVRVGAMKPGPRDLAEQEITGGMQLLVTTHAPEDARIVAVRLTRTTRRACSGGSRALFVRVDVAPEAPLPAAIGGDHRVALAFRASPEEALEGPTAVDVVVEQHGHLSCVRTELGPARDWHRPQLAIEVDLTVGAPLQSLGNIATPIAIEERIGALLGPVDASAGLRVGLASCGACDNGWAVLLGPSAAATFFPFTARPLALGLTLSYASLFETVTYPTDPAGSLPHVGEWYQVPGVALQLDWLAPPRNSRVRLRGRDFNDWGLEVFEQLWIPTLHAERPTSVVGLGLVSRIAM